MHFTIIGAGEKIQGGDSALSVTVFASGRKDHALMPCEMAINERMLKGVDAGDFVFQVQVFQI